MQKTAGLGLLLVLLGCSSSEGLSDDGPLGSEQAALGLGTRSLVVGNFANGVMCPSNNVM
jgi:hypothetical protein